MSAPPLPPATLAACTEADAAELAALGARLFTETYAEHNTPEDLRAHLAAVYDPARVAGELRDADARWWIARDADGAGVGYAWIRRGRPAPPGVVASAPVELARIYVARAWQGRGVAAALMAAAVDAARGWRGDVLWLTVWERAPWAIRFYGKSGFAAVGTTSFLVGADEQRDLVLARPLGHP